MVGHMPGMFHIQKGRRGERENEQGGGRRGGEIVTVAVINNNDNGLRYPKFA